MPEPDTLTFRRALGQFATGVTVVTTHAPSGAPVGVTANSFNSVSLDPPMVLWSLAKSSGSMDAFTRAEAFAVHVLASDQVDLSNRFARRGTDKFAGLPLDDGPVPLLPGCAARFLCRTAYQYEGGDHVIFVGEVQDFEAEGRAPLLYLGGRYAEARREGDTAPQAIDPGSVRIGEQSVTHLIARAFVQVTRHLHRELDACSMQQPRLMIMIAIEQHDHPTADEIVERVLANRYDISRADVDALETLGWIRTEGGRVFLTSVGRQHYFEALSRLNALEQHYCEGLSDGELAELRFVLGHIIDRTDEGAPTLI